MFNEFWEYFRVILYTACHYHGFQRVSFQSLGIVSPIILTVKRGLRQVGGGAKSGAGLRYLLNTPAFKRSFGGLVLYSTYFTFTNEFFDVFVVKDESMLPALEEGNWVVVKRVGFTGYIRCALPLLPAFLGYKVELETKVKQGSLGLITNLRIGGTPVSSSN